MSDSDMGVQTTVAVPEKLVDIAKSVAIRRIAVDGLKDGYEK
ncbi:hypothetical protein [Cypionkella psychrotolerans]|nr:hypothetical protein [Cypionkella psychrotolerans]